MSKLLVHVIPAIPFAISTVIAAGIATLAGQPPADAMVRMEARPPFSGVVDNPQAISDLPGVIGAAADQCREITGHFTVQLRPNLSGNGDRRIYTIVAECPAIADTAQRATMVATVPTR